MPPARRYNGRTVSQRTERIALWVRDLYVLQGSITYGETRRRVMDHFGCGHVAAERAIQAANAMQAELLGSKENAQRVLDALWDQHARAVRKGHERSALLALDRIAKLHGLYKPEKVEHSGVVARLDVASLSDEELETEYERVRAIEQRARERGDC